MGASTSFVSVQLERPYYYPGEVLTGVLCLNVLKPLEARHLEVTVHGVEKTHWTETHTTHHTDSKGQSHSTTHTETYTQKINICDVRSRGSSTSYPLGLPGAPPYAPSRNASYVVPPGQYQWPFSFALPPTLPPSWSYNHSLDYGNERTFPVFDHIAALAAASSRGGSEYGEIRYEVRAHLERPGMLVSDLRNAVQFGIMTSPHALPPPKPVLSRYCEESKMCCCISRGLIQGQASLSKDVLIPGEMAHLMIEVDNASKTDVSAIELHLIMYVMLSAHGRRRNRQRAWQLATGAGVPAGCQSMSGEAIQLSFKVPPCMPATHSAGSISHAYYMLQVRMKTHSLAKDICVELPVILNRTQSSGSVGYPAAPDFWRPQVMPAFAFAAPGIPVPAPPKWGAEAAAGAPGPAQGYDAGPSTGYPTAGTGPSAGYPAPGAPGPSAGYPGAAGPPMSYPSAAGPATSYPAIAGPSASYPVAAEPPASYPAAAAGPSATLPMPVKK